jgi:hypothetical protein
MNALSRTSRIRRLHGGVVLRPSLIPTRSLKLSASRPYSTLQYTGGRYGTAVSYRTVQYVGWPHKVQNSMILYCTVQYVYRCWPIGICGFTLACFVDKSHNSGTRNV